MTIFNNFFSTIFAQKDIVIYLGSNATIAMAFVSSKLVESKVVKAPFDENIIVSFNDFLTKYKKSKMSIIVDDNRFIQHKLSNLVVIDSIVAKDAIENHIDIEYDHTDLVSTSIIESNENQSSIKALFVSCRIFPLLNEWIDYMTSDFKFSGIYLLPFESSSIAHHIIKKHSGVSITPSDILLFVTVTETEGIRITATQNKNVLINIRCDYPHDKSAEYIEGIIEHEIGEACLKLKASMANDEEVHLIAMLPDEIKRLMKFETKFFASEKILGFMDVAQQFTTTDNLKSLNADIIIADIILSKRPLPAQSKRIASFLNLYNFNNLMFRPFLIGAFILIAINAYYKFSTYKNNKTVDEINNAYFKYASQYRSLKEKYSNIPNLDNAIELLKIENFILKTPPKPFDQFNIFLNQPYITLDKISWQLLDYDNFDATSSVNIKYIPNVQQNMLTEFTKYIEELKKHTPGFDVFYTRIPQASTASLPVKITIQKMEKKVD